jgi:hypothetical protein
MQPKQSFARIAKHPANTWVGINVIAIDVGDQDPIDGTFKQHLIASLAFQASLLAGKSVEGKADVAGHFQQQLADLVVEGVVFSGIDGESTYHRAIAVQGQGRRAFPAMGSSTIAPGRGQRMMGEIECTRRLRFRELPFPSGRVRKGLAASIEIVMPSRYSLPLAERRHRLDQSARRLHHSDPRHFHAAEGDGIPANLREQFSSVALRTMAWLHWLKVAYKRVRRRMLASARCRSVMSECVPIMRKGLTGRIACDDKAARQHPEIGPVLAPEAMLAHIVWRLAVEAGLDGCWRWRPRSSG